MPFENIINKQDRDLNVGTISKILFIPTDWIASGLPVCRVTPSKKVINVYSGIVKKTVNDWGAASKWYRAEYSVDTAEWTTDEQVTPDGIVYKENITWTVAKHYDFRRPDFDEMEYREYCVVVIDNNSKAVIFGYTFLDGQKKGMRLIKKKTTGKLRSDLNYYTLNFYMDGYVQPWVADINAANVVTSGDYNDDFADDFSND